MIYVYMSSSNEETYRIKFHLHSSLNFVATFLDELSLITS